jgi:hypothetical protein
MLMRTILTALSFFCLITGISAQDNIIKRRSFLSVNYLQVKESANFGLVFKGAGFDHGMTWSLDNDKTRMIYEYELGLGILFSREIPALGFYLKPVDFAYIFKLRVHNSLLHIGPDLRLEYNYNLYPDLQSGFDYWFTNLSLGINVMYDFNYANSAFYIKLSSSVAGFTSRQPGYRDPYFYDLGVKHAIRHLNQDLTFGSFNRYNSTNLEIRWKPKPDSRLTFGYVLKYSGYFMSPEITMLSHGIKLIVNKKQKQND